MVTPIKNSEPKKNLSKRGLIVELVGLAGTGKTTIFNELGRRNRSIVQKNIPNTRTLIEIPFFIRNSFFVAPTLLQIDRSIRNSITRREIAWLIILHGWANELRKLEARSGKIIVIDQGAVYLFSQLLVSHQEMRNHPSVEKYWQRLYQRWASTIDILVLLDAPNACLAGRINTRPEWHLIKCKPEVEINEFLAQFRCAYDFTISQLTSFPIRPKVIKIDTHQYSLNDVVDQLLSEWIHKI